MTMAATVGAALTARQREVMRYVFFGKTNEEIGQLLGRSPLTIKNHLRSIMRVLGAHNRQNAVYNAIARCEIDVPAHIPECAVCPVEIRQLKGCEEVADWMGHGDLLLSAQLRTVRRNGDAVVLNRTDFRVLMFFLERPKTVHSRDSIIDGVWGVHAAVEERMVDVHVSRVRAALKSLGCANLIETVRGLGYKVAA